MVGLLNSRLHLNPLFLHYDGVLQFSLLTSILIYVAALVCYLQTGEVGRGG